MRSLVTLAMFGAAVLIYPLFAERTNSYCVAFEHRYRSLAADQIDQAARRDPSIRALVGLAQFGSAGGGLGESYARVHLPRLPTPVACNIAYWRSVHDPSLAFTVAQNRP